MSLNKTGLFIICYILCSAVIFARRDTILINNTSFIFQTLKIYHEDEGNTDEILKIYRIEDGQNTYLLSHILFEDHVDCNSESMELGTYSISESSITFYTHWSKGGDAPGYPCGVRKQVYTVGIDGKLAMTAGMAYIDKGSMQTEETDYNAEQISESNAGNLIKEVHKVFLDDLNKFTDYWTKINSGFGFCVY